MPAMGESVTEGTILEWHVAEGEEVSEGDTIVEVSTDKIDAEVPAPASGVITKIMAQPDDTVSVGQVLAQLDTNGAGNGAAPAASRRGRPGDHVGLRRANPVRAELSRQRPERRWARDGRRWWRRRGRRRHRRERSRGAPGRRAGRLRRRLARAGHGRTPRTEAPAKPDRRDARDGRVGHRGHGPRVGRRGRATRSPRATRSSRSRPTRSTPRCRLPRRAPSRSFWSSRTTSSRSASRWPR